MGQDNFLMYRVQPRIVFRIQDHDSPMDVLRTFAAALSVKNPLEVSWQRSNSSLNITDQWRHLLSSFRFVEESEGSFLHRVKSGAFKRVRLLSAPSQDLNWPLPLRRPILPTFPCCPVDEFELLHYLREMALSVDYHRYGNLGLREGEVRKPIL